MAVVSLTAIVLYQYYQNALLSRELETLRSTGSLPSTPATPEPPSARAALSQGLPVPEPLADSPVDAPSRAPTAGSWSDEAPVTQPPLEIAEDSERYYVKLELQFVDESVVDVRFENGFLRIEGETTELGVDEAAAGSPESDEPTVSVAKRTPARFSKVVALAGPVQADRITTAKRDNLFIVTVPKAVGR